MKAKKNIPVRAQVKDMKVGDILAFPIDRMSSIRSMISSLSVEMDRSYSTAINRMARTLTVTRNS